MSKAGRTRRLTGRNGRCFHLNGPERCHGSDSPTEDRMKAEIIRRQSLASQLEAYFKARPGQWLPMHELAMVGGIGGFRTRISELRLTRDMRIEWNGFNGARSAHRYLPHDPLGRDAAVPAPDRWPVPGAPYEEPFQLT
jgi:hypothetical protein